MSEVEKLRDELERLKLNTLAQGFLLELGEAGSPQGRQIRALTKRLKNQREELAKLRTAHQRLHRQVVGWMALLTRVAETDIHAFGAQTRLIECIGLITRVIKDYHRKEP